MSTLTINTISRNEEKDIPGKIIRRANIANELLDRGNRIIHLKADKMDPDRKRSVYVFYADEKLENDLDEIMQRRRQEREESFEERVQREVEARLKAMSEE